MADHRITQAALATLGIAFLPVAAFAGTATVTTAEKEPYGAHLTDGKGMSLYLFEGDESGESACYDACAEAWPPVTTDGEPRAGDGVDASRLGTIERKHGSTQVTYGGAPLYRFVKDKTAGATKGQDVEGFGDEWYLVSPDGGPIEEEDEDEEEEEHEDEEAETY